MKRKYHYIIILFFICTNLSVFSQNDIRVVDHKGTKRNINKVTYGTLTPTLTAPANNEKGDTYIIGTATNPEQIFLFDGTQWVETSANNWKLTGNTGTNPATNFLGTTDNVKLSLRSNNTSLLELGQRGTLGLNSTVLDYNNPNQSLVYINGNNPTGVAAMQFRSDASSRKPLFFSTTNGNFRIRGGSGTTDQFEIGTAGSGNDGRLEFIVGDDGLEPMVFKRYRHSNQSFKEFFRVQAASNATNSKTRFGININQAYYLTSNNLTAPSNGGGKEIANSTFQVKGSVSKSIEEITTGTGNFNLTEDHHTIVLKTNRNIVLPAAANCEGRLYVIKNISGGVVTSSNYQNQLNVTSTSINDQTSLIVQSNGTEWVEISATISANNWALNGNPSTNPATNFLGTTDAQDLILKANNETRVRLRQEFGQVLINNANNFGTTSGPSLMLRANGGNNELLGFQNTSGNTKWHINFRTNGFNIAETGVEDYRLFIKENTGNVGINTDVPTERLDIAGKTRIRTIDNQTTPLNNGILTTNNNGVIEQIPLISADAGNLISYGSDGGTLLTPTSLNSWSLTGNTGTNPATNFLGTTDAQDLVLKANNTEALRILNNNRFVGIGTSTPTSTLHVVGDHPDGVGLLRLEGTEPDINFNDTNGGFNTFTFENNGQGRVLIGRDIDDNFYISRRVGTNLWQDQTFRILNSNGNVGININRLAATDNVPSEKLDVNGKLRVRDVSEVTNLSVGDKIVIIDANGVVKKIAGSFHTVGDIKHGVQSGDHNGWYLLDGRALSSLPANAEAAALSLSLPNLATNLPDATDKVLKHLKTGELIFDDGGSATTVLTQPNLPNVNFLGNTTTTGEHQHQINFRSSSIVLWHNDRGITGNDLRTGSTRQATTTNSGGHSHDVEVSSGGNNTPFPNYQPYLVVNTFIYLGL